MGIRKLEKRIIKYFFIRFIKIRRFIVIEFKARIYINKFKER